MHSLSANLDGSKSTLKIGAKFMDLLVMTKNYCKFVPPEFNFPLILTSNLTCRVVLQSRVDPGLSEQ